MVASVSSRGLALSLALSWPNGDSRQRRVQRIEWDASHCMALAGSDGAMALPPHVADRPRQSRSARIGPENQLPVNPLFTQLNLLYRLLAAPLAASRTPETAYTGSRRRAARSPLPSRARDRAHETAAPASRETGRQRLRRQGERATRMDEDWAVSMSFLPERWRELASETGALRMARGCAAVTLRTTDAPPGAWAPRTGGRCRRPRRFGAGGGHGCAGVRHGSTPRYTVAGSSASSRSDLAIK